MVAPEEHQAALADANKPTLLADDGRRLSECASESCASILGDADGVRRFLSQRKPYLLHGYLALDDAELAEVRRLEERVRACKAACAWQEAQAAVDALTGMKALQGGRLRADLDGRQAAEMSDLQRVYDSESAKFDAYWAARLAKYEDGFMAALRKMEAAHDDGMADLQAQLDATRPVKPQASISYLRLQKRQHALGRLNLFTEAAQLQAIMDQVHNHDMYETLAQYDESAQNAIRQLASKQRGELEVLCQRGKMGREELLMKQASQSKQRVTRLKAVISELLGLHKVELAQLQAFLDKHVVAGKATPQGMAPSAPAPPAELPRSASSARTSSAGGASSAAVAAAGGGHGSVFTTHGKLLRELSDTGCPVRSDKEWLYTPVWQEPHEHAHLIPISFAPKERRVSEPNGGSSAAGGSSGRATPLRGSAGGAKRLSSTGSSGASAYMEAAGIRSQRHSSAGGSSSGGGAAAEGGMQKSPPFSKIASVEAKFMAAAGASGSLQASRSSVVRTSATGALPPRPTVKTTADAGKQQQQQMPSGVVMATSKSNSRSASPAPGSSRATTPSRRLAPSRSRPGTPVACA